MPKVSVIVPVYNVEKYLRRCLDSLVNQTLKDIEIVIVNDGSKDSSPDICQEYINKYPDKIIYATQTNQGQAVARNKAFDMCTGEYIGFLDSDDYVSLGMFEQMYETAIKEEADYVACGYTDMMYDEDGRDHELVHYVASKVAKETKDLFFGALVSPFLHLYKRNVIMDTGVRFTEGVIYEDTAFYLKLIPHTHRMAAIEKPLAFRTRHANSTMTTFVASKVEQFFTVIDDAISYYKNNGFYETYKEELEYFCVRVLLCSSMERIGKVSDKKERNRLLQKTLSYIDSNFPDYRKNPYFKGGMQNRYMLIINKKNASILARFIWLKGRFGKKYS